MYTIRQDKPLNPVIVEILTTVQVVTKALGYGYLLVATGWADISVDPIMNPWDIAALVPVIRGAGGVISDWQGADAYPAKSTVACATPELHAEVLAALRATDLDGPPVAVYRARRDLACAKRRAMRTGHLHEAFPPERRLKDPTLMSMALGMTDLLQDILVEILEWRAGDIRLKQLACQQGASGSGRREHDEVPSRRRANGKIRRGHSTRRTCSVCDSGMFWSRKMLP